MLLDNSSDLVGTRARLTKVNEPTDDEFKLFRDLVLKDLGLEWGDDKKYLLYARLQRILQEHQLETFQSYYDYIEINSFLTGAISIGIISGAYSTEVFRGAIQSIDKGQFEACHVLGLKKYIYFFKVIMPQMLRLAIPNLSNVWQITLKDTSLISVTGLVEIMRQSYIAAGSTRDPLFFYSFAALLYLMLTYLSMKFINRLEKNYSKGY